MRLVLFPYKTDKVFDHTAHKRLWLWLADHPWASKEEWPGWKNCYPQLHDCFACDFASAVKKTWLLIPINSKCDFCPLVHNDKLNCLNGWYGLWDSLEKIPKNYSLLRKLAHKIALLPVRKGVLVR